MSDIKNPNPRLWRSNFMAFDLDQIQAICVSEDDDDDDEGYLLDVYLVGRMDAIPIILNEESATSLMNAWTIYRSER